jgi:hypothetical protein
VYDPVFLTHYQPEPVDNLAFLSFIDQFNICHFLLSGKEYCKSTQCVQAASSIMAAMDPDVHPCKDFFQYACGGWVRQNPIPKGYHKWDRVQELSGQNLYVLKGFLGKH